MGIAMSPYAAKCLLKAEAISEGVMLATFQLRSRNLTVISAYAPTNDYADSEKDNFFTELQSAIDKCASRDIMFIGGDFNAQLGA